ncbi:hypothetical protein KIPB_002716 [Kipferlia bialata]|uniref:Uncharacterized protein n=1 Tax=Kipferlia bialata TaxID=797122 RepID=A0A9K3CSS1_9EUKA|nr:hypothetical protein KIPB_002716 [Kipferlia bialata]|eukprot:g2716.t1
MKIGVSSGSQYQMIGQQAKRTAIVGAAYALLYGLLCLQGANYNPCLALVATTFPEAPDALISLSSTCMYSIVYG